MCLQGPTTRTPLAVAFSEGILHGTSRLASFGRTLWFLKPWAFHLGFWGRPEALSLDLLNLPFSHLKVWGRLLLGGPKDPV